MSALPRRHRFAAALLAAGLLVPGPAPCRAEDDGGTRSVFALGPGNRALGLGGAFSAVADDASGPLWNPGGLGAVAQAQVQISQADLYGEGILESYLGVVYPRWRWGAASFSFRQFGAGGIELRDDRNQLLGSDVRSRETEIALGYGRALGGAWGLGATAKVRRQELAGRSGSGLGADVGVLVRPAEALGWSAPWARDLTAGLSVANLLEPAIRLDRESVPDPGAARFGLAWRHPLFALGHWLAALDFEKARGTTGTLRAGLELVPHPLLALRAGMNGPLFTAGTELRWGDAALDYAFENGSIGSGHRAGLSYRFGRTVDEERVAVARAEEEHVQARIAEFERQRDRQRAASLLERAEAARAAGRPDDALELLELLRALDPENEPARALQAACLREKGRALEAGGDCAAAAIEYGRALAVAPEDQEAAAALARCRAQSDARAARTAEIARLFAAALDAFSREDLPAARQGFAAILRMSPKDAGARTMLTRVEDAAARRAAGLVQQARLLARAGADAGAAELLASARALDPQASGLAEVQSLLDRRREQAGREGAETERARPAAGLGGATAPRAGPPALSPAQQRELADLYKRGLAAMGRGRADDALRYFELVWSMRPGYERAGDFLEREYQTRGMEAFAAGRLQEAVKLWGDALEVDSSDARTLGYLARAHEQLARSREISGERR